LNAETAQQLDRARATIFSIATTTDET
jgi:hypothetical protein